MIDYARYDEVRFEERLRHEVRITDDELFTDPDRDLSGFVPSDR